MHTLIVRFVMGSVLALMTYPVAAQITPAGSAHQNTPLPQSGIDLAAMDSSVDPCVDFYRFSCGNWAKVHSYLDGTSPRDQWDLLHARNDAQLINILEHAAISSDSDATTKVVGEFYSSCMDTAAIKRRGLAPIQDDLDAIGKARTLDDISRVILTLQQKNIQVLFNLSGVREDTEIKLRVTPVRFGLPDAASYVASDALHRSARERYVQHITKMLMLYGKPESQAARSAARIVQIEALLAQPPSTPKPIPYETARMFLWRLPNASSWSISQGPVMDASDRDRLAKDLQLDRLFEDLHVLKSTDFELQPRAYFESVSTLLSSADVNDWRDFLSWSVLRERALLLPDPFYSEELEFQTALARPNNSGPTALGTSVFRKQFCAQLTEQQLEPFVAQLYAGTIDVSTAETTKRLAANLKESARREVGQLSWLSHSARNHAEFKLQHTADRLLAPKQILDYRLLKVAHDDFAGNVDRAIAAQVRSELERIGTHATGQEWNSSPLSEKVSYVLRDNAIELPAPQLLPPFFVAGDWETTYGALGSLWGHELVHSFDERGSMLTAGGGYPDPEPLLENRDLRLFTPQLSAASKERTYLEDWWTTADLTAFKQHAACLVDQYSHFAANPGTGQTRMLDGAKSLYENSADNGGLRISYAAMLQEMKKRGVDPATRTDGYTPAQRFFIGFGQVWCDDSSTNAVPVSAKTLSRIPGKYRANGSVQNFPEFGKAFSCKVGQPMMPQNPCRVW